ncbi:MAG: hypothetical protein KDD94_02755 [Calditrichaeota bacterium]|nr:hypothetical protein [Calditrichota bacterium]
MKETGWKYIFIELIAVFIGVYGAFELNTIQEDRRKHEIKQNYYKSFTLELQGIDAIAKQQLATIDTILKIYTLAISNKEFLTLRYYPELDFTVNMPIVKSAFISTHFENIDPNFLRNISFGSNHLTLLEKRMDRYVMNCQRLLYNNQVSSHQFYQTNGQLKPEFAWYLEDLKILRLMFVRLVQIIEKGALPDVKKLIESTQ